MPQRSHLPPQIQVHLHHPQKQTGAQGEERRAPICRRWSRLVRHSRQSREKEAWQKPRQIGPQSRLCTKAVVEQQNASPVLLHSAGSPHEKRLGQGSGLAPRRQRNWLDCLAMANTAPDCLIDCTKGLSRCPCEECEQYSPGLERCKAHLKTRRRSKRDVQLFSPGDGTIRRRRSTWFRHGPLLIEARARACR